MRPVSEPWLVLAIVFLCFPFSVNFRKFLTASDAELAGVKAAAKAAGGDKGGFLSWVATKSTGLFSGGVTSKSAEDLSFEEIASYVTEMEPILTNVIRHAQSLIRRRRGASLHSHLLFVFVSLETIRPFSFVFSIS